MEHLDRPLRKHPGRTDSIRLQRSSQLRDGTLDSQLDTCLEGRFLRNYLRQSIFQKRKRITVQEHLML